MTSSNKILQGLSELRSWGERPSLSPLHLCPAGTINIAPQYCLSVPNSGQYKGDGKRKECRHCFRRGGVRLPPATSNQQARNTQCSLK